MSSDVSFLRLNVMVTFIKFYYKVKDFGLVMTMTNNLTLWIVHIVSGLFLVFIIMPHRTNLVQNTDKKDRHWNQIKK